MKKIFSLLFVAICINFACRAETPSSETSQENSSYRFREHEQLKKTQKKIADLEDKKRELYDFHAMLAKDYHEAEKHREEEYGEEEYVRMWKRYRDRQSLDEKRFAKINAALTTEQNKKEKLEKLINKKCYLCDQWDKLEQNHKQSLKNNNEDLVRWFIETTNSSFSFDPHNRIIQKRANPLVSAEEKLDSSIEEKNQVVEDDILVSHILDTLDECKKAKKYHIWAKW